MRLTRANPPAVVGEMLDKWREVTDGDPDPKFGDQGDGNEIKFYHMADEIWGCYPSGEADSELVLHEGVYWFFVDGGCVGHFASLEDANADLKLLMTEEFDAYWDAWEKQA
jgi:hypothetical protein